MRAVPAGHQPGSAARFAQAVVLTVCASLVQVWAAAQAMQLR